MKDWTLKLGLDRPRVSISLGRLRLHAFKRSFWLGVITAHSWIDLHLGPLMIEYLKRR